MPGDVTDGWDAARVKALRTRLGLSQERFAARVGATAGTVNRWEAGSRAPMPMACELLDRLEREERAR